MHKGSDITFSSRHLQSSGEEKWISQVIPRRHVFVLEIYIQSTVTCWESQSQCTWAVAHSQMPVMNIGANFSQTPLCHSSMQLASVFSNVCPERAVWLTMRRTQVRQIVFTHFNCEIGYYSLFVPFDVRKCCVISTCIRRGLTHKVIV